MRNVYNKRRKTDKEGDSNKNLIKNLIGDIFDHYSNYTDSERNKISYSYCIFNNRIFYVKNGHYVMLIVASSFELRSKKMLIEAFIDNIDSTDNVSKDWSKFVQKKAIEELDEIILNKNLNKKETYELMEFSLKNETLNLDGSKLDKIMPPVSIFGGRAKKKEELTYILQEYFDKYCYIVYVLVGDNNV